MPQEKIREESLEVSRLDSAGKYQVRAGSRLFYLDYQPIIDLKKTAQQQEIRRQLAQNLCRDYPELVFATIEQGYTLEILVDGILSK